MTTLPRFFALVAFAILLSTSLLPSAHANGRDARHCISDSWKDYEWDNRDEVGTFRNTCNENIYIIYCGDQHGSNRRCGDGDGSATYYTHSHNLRPGQEYDVRFSSGGEAVWGGCFGTISFRNNGNFRDERNGRYTCLR